MILGIDIGGLDAAVVAGFLAIGSCGTNPFGVIEGANVLAAMVMARAA